MKTLSQAVQDNPFSDFRPWWEMGDDFAAMMSEAILAEWNALDNGTDNGLDDVGSYLTRYLDIVYDNQARSGLLSEFVDQALTETLQSGEFDALSYAFYRSSFERLAARPANGALESERREFTRRVGRRFFDQVDARLKLDLEPESDRVDLLPIKTAIDAVNKWLLGQGYFRDHCAFRFDLAADRVSTGISQSEQEAASRLDEGRTAYAVFEMGYPVILPSAVYLYQTIGEAQHHSSRTVEELFSRFGLTASETDDFDPSGYPPEMLVESWQINRPGDTV